MQAGTGEIRIQDLSRLMEESTRTLHDLDERLRTMRSQLAGAIGQASGGRGIPDAIPRPSLGSFDAFSTPTPQAWPLPPWNLGAGMPGASQSPGPSGGPSIGSPGSSGPPGSTTGTFAGGGATRSTRELRDQPPMPRIPPCDVVDEGKAFRVQMDLPGVQKDDMDLLVTDRAVIITATARPETGDGVLVLGERGPIVYRRTVPFPVEIKTDGTKAKLKDGVLSLEVPKKEPTNGPRRLDVAYG